MSVSQPFDIAARLADRTRELEPVADAGLGTDPVAVPRSILAAVRDALLAGETHYSSRPGLPSLRKHVVDDLASWGAPAYDAATGVIITAGEREALFVTLLGLRLGKADVWTAGDAARYAALFRFMGLTPRALDRGGSLRPSAGMVYREWTASAEAHREAARLAGESGVVDVLNLGSVVGASERRALPPDIGERTVLLGGFDTLPGQAAFGAGFVAGPAVLLKSIRTWKQAFSICTAAPSQRAAVTALDAQRREIA